jgi:hypothetical protein
MSFWNEDHPLQWKYKQVEKALPLFGASDNEDLTEAANLICLVYDYYNNGSLAANIEARLSRYKEECKYGSQMFKDWFEQVYYWYEHDSMPSDEEQDWYCTQWLESMLESVDFEFDESKNPNLPKRKRDEPPKSDPPKPKKRRVYKCSKCGMPKKGHTCKAKVPQFAVTKDDFIEYKAYQRCSVYGLPQWFMTDDKKASEIMNKYNELDAHYKI